MKVKTVKYALLARWHRLREILSPTKISTGHDIPIVINNFNRLSTLKRLIESLERRGLTNIHILDNASTYPPLLDFYKTCRYDVVMLGRNLGFKALWKDRATRRRFCRDYYIYTDSDVMLTEECPDDVVNCLFRLLRDKYRYASKIGLALRTDNLPDCFRNKRQVIEWESRLISPVNSDGLHRAPTDTTFALYRAAHRALPQPLRRSLSHGSSLLSAPLAVVSGQRQSRRRRTLLPRPLLARHTLDSQELNRIHCSQCRFFWNIGRETVFLSV